MVTYEYVAFKKRAGEMQAESTSKGYLAEFYAQGGDKGDSPAFVNFMGLRGFRFKAAYTNYNGEGDKVQGYSIWLERASERHCEHCAETVATMDGLERLT